MQKTESERAVVVGVGLKSQSFVELKESLSELEDLVYAAGGEVVGTLVQVLDKFNPATLLGTGKIKEIKELCLSTNAGLVLLTTNSLEYKLET